jgi:DNA-binding response OmpR family regulator
MSRILIVEDNAELAAGIKHNLEFEGYDVHIALDGPSGIEAVRSFTPDLIILDVMLPGIDGFQVLRTIRQTGVVTPVLMLTSLGEEADKVRAFRLDADQFVTKPFRLVELLERIAMMLRRSSAQSATTASRDKVIKFGDVTVDTASRRVIKAGNPVGLSPRAFDLFLALAERPGVVLSRHELLKRVWEHQASVVTRTVDSHISELRQKLEDRPDDPQHIVTVWKSGYRFDP